MPSANEKPIVVVTAHKTRHPAKLLRVNRDGTADLEIEYRGEKHTITSAPRDEEGKKPDSWDYVKEEEKTESPTGEGKTSGAK